MNKFIPISLFSFATIFVIGSCSILDGPEDISNPMDPNDPDFVLPSAVFVQAPNDGSIVDTCLVVFEWEGNQPSMNYSYQIDDKGWSEWTSDQTIEYPFLNEGSHSFELKLKYYNGVESDAPQEINFSVDDIDGPALWLYPRLTEVTIGQQFSVEVMAEDVTDLAMMTVSINYRSNIIQIQDIVVYEDNSAFLRTNGGTVIPFYEFDNTTGSLTIDVGVATGFPTGVSGTGTIARIDFTSTGNGITQIQFNSSSEMRDSDNKSILLQELTPGNIRIE